MQVLAYDYTSVLSMSIGYDDCYGHAAIYSHKPPKTLQRRTTSNLNLSSRALPHGSDVV